MACRNFWKFLLYSVKDSNSFHSSLPAATFPVVLTSSGAHRQLSDRIKAKFAKIR
ncbi:hypothetical protein ANCDUO_21105 [Ancylostoma duodenale]|uniref:Uncharacterized protein n=1 Tax=Ancylostoma duodenale TaxID=51022 RepID=A0A0C2CGB9_9BILA|nr:hypothetical protein ANCDUO_21105 [Ancylostoma duodenale]